MLLRGWLRGWSRSPGQPNHRAMTSTGRLASANGSHTMCWRTAGKAQIELAVIPRRHVKLAGHDISASTTVVQLSTGRA